MNDGRHKKNERRGRNFKDTRDGSGKNVKRERKPREKERKKSEGRAGGSREKSQTRGGIWGIRGKEDRDEGKVRGREGNCWGEEEG